MTKKKNKTFLVTVTRTFMVDVEAKTIEEAAEKFNKQVNEGKHDEQLNNTDCFNVEIEQYD